jgi:hypothetical protein
VVKHAIGTQANGILLGDAAGWGFTMVDTETDQTIGDDGNELNATYY